MKRHIYFLSILVTGLLNLVFLCGCSPDEEVTNDIHEKFQENYEQVKAHSATLTLLRNKINIATRTLGNVTIDVRREEAYQTIKNAYFEQETDPMLRTEAAYEYITLQNPTAISDVYRDFGHSFFDNLSTLITLGKDENVLRRQLESLLNRYVYDRNYNVYMGLAAIALDSYVYWSDNIHELNGTGYSVLTVFTSIVKADVISAASTLIYCGTAALWTAIATGGATALPTIGAVAGKAAVGSAIVGVSWLFR